MASWRLAYSLETLRSQVNTAYPNRSKVSDGTIGDTAHASTASDHNPNAAGVVTAMDLTHDPAHGFDAHKTADMLLVNRHPNLKYIISNRRIAGAWTGWKWVAYTGAIPHDKHIHISVGVGNDGYSTQPYDDITKWSIKGDEMFTAEQIKNLADAGGIPQTQQQLNDGATKPAYEVALNFIRTVQKDANQWHYKHDQLLNQSGGTVLAPGNYKVE